MRQASPLPKSSSVLHTAVLLLLLLLLRPLLIVIMLPNHVYTFSLGTCRLELSVQLATAVS